MDGPSEEFQIPNQQHDLNPLTALQKYVNSLESTVRQKDESIKQLKDQLNELKTHKSPDPFIQNRDVRLEFRRAIDKLFDEYFPSETLPQTQHYPQTSAPLEVNPSLFHPTVEHDEYAASSSTSTNHTFNHSNPLNQINHIHNHSNHEPTDSGYSVTQRPNEYLEDNNSSFRNNENKSMPIMHAPMTSLSSTQTQRRFGGYQNGMNGTSNNNHNYHNNNNNNNRNSNNNNNNNNNHRKGTKYTVFVSWSGKMEREDLNNLFDLNDVADIRHSPTKQFAHFDFKTQEAMKKALTYDKQIKNPEHGQLRVELGKPRSNNTENNNNNNNGQRPQNKSYNNRPQNKQNGNINGYNQQKTYPKYTPNGSGINNIINNHSIPDDINDSSIPSQGMMLNSFANHSDH